MTATTSQPNPAEPAPSDTPTGGRYLWMSNAPFTGDDLTVMTHGEGSLLYDTQGNEYLDALSSLYCVNVGHGRASIGDAMAEQAKTLEFFPAWGKATPPAVRLAERIVRLAPGDMRRVFFTSGGSDSVDTMWKMVRQYHRLRGNASKFGLISRMGSYHGVSLGALPVSGMPKLHDAFAPLASGVWHAPKVDVYHSGTDAQTHSRDAANAVADLVAQIGPSNLGAIVVEPVQNSGGCLTPHPDYYRIIRRICDENDLLMVSDEVICSFGRLGTMFGCEYFGYEPDIILTAKGLTSAYAPMGAVIANARTVEPFEAEDVFFNHGLTFSAHPVVAAAALANLDIIEGEDLCARATAMGEILRAGLESLHDIPIVGDVRGAGLFQAIELTSDQASRAPLTAEDAQVLQAVLPAKLEELRIVCRCLHRGAPIVQFAPTLVVTEAEIDRLLRGVREALEVAARAVAARRQG